MSYFQKNYSKIDLTSDSETKVQLRRPQIGAIHSIASYFTRSLERNDLDPAIIVLPTGSGKTAVLVLSPFLLQVKRVLIITQSQIVRRQIFREFSELILLKKLKILPENIPSPRVYELDKMLKAGEVLSAEVLPKFARAVELAYDIENVERINTLVAAQNRLTKSWQLFIKNITEGDRQWQRESQK